MKNDRRESRSSIFHSSDSKADFDFFRTIENTLKGVLSFIVAYVHTSWLLLISPRRMTVYMADDGLARRCQPYTYLVFSAFAASLAAKYHGLDFVFDPAIRNVSPDLSTTGLVITTFPAIALTVFLGWLLACAVSGTPARRRHIVELVCYSSGFQCLVVVVTSIVVAGYFAKVGTRSDLFIGDLVDFLNLLLFWTVIALFATLIPLAVLWRPVTRDASRAARGLRRVATLLGLWAFSATTLFVCVVPSRVLRDVDMWALVGAREPTPEISCWIASAALNGQNSLTIDVVLSNDDATEWLIRKAPVGLNVEVREAREGSIAHMRSPANDFSADIVSWADGAAPVLVVSKGSPKWATLRVQIPGRLMEDIRPDRDLQIEASWITFQDLKQNRSSCSTRVLVAALHRS
jgi:hypothetical protein